MHTRPRATYRSEPSNFMESKYSAPKNREDFGIGIRYNLSDNVNYTNSIIIEVVYDDGNVQTLIVPECKNGIEN